jgi:hypothetical protein
MRMVKHVIAVLLLSEACGPTNGPKRVEHMGRSPKLEDSFAPINASFVLISTTTSN